MLTPFALGLAIGGIASGRVPGDSVDSWWNATSVVVGFLSVTTAAYVAAVWLTADAARAGEEDLVALFQRLALGSGAVAGALAVVGVIVLHSDDKPIYDGLTSGLGLVCLIGSVAAGVLTPLLLAWGRFEYARYCAAVAVGAVVTGWAVAQSPYILPGVTAEDAAASNATIVALLISVAVGALILIPSLTLLFGLVLHGRFDEGAAEVAADEAAEATGIAPASWMLRAAIACAVVGLPLMLAFDSGVGLGAGVGAGAGRGRAGVRGDGAGGGGGGRVAASRAVSHLGAVRLLTASDEGGRGVGGAAGCAGHAQRFCQ